MKPKSRKREQVGLLWVAAILAAWPAALLAQEGGNRVLFPDHPMPVFNTIAPNVWASSNLTSVPLSAGGSAVVTNLSGVKRYPFNQPEQPDPDYTPAYVLAYSSFGHVVTGNRPDFYLGDPIVAPQASEVGLASGWSLNWSAMNSTNITGGAIYEASVQQLYATAGGQVTVTWVFTDGTSNTNIIQTYLVSGTPSQRPKRIYWTEPPYNAPTVNLAGRHVKFIWNTDIPAPQTNSSGTVVRGLFRDASGLLHAAPGPDPQPRDNPLQGMVVMQYFKTGDLAEQVPGGVVVVEVRRPEVGTLDAKVGKRLLPKDSPYGYRGLDAHVTRGTESPAHVYKHQGQYTHSPKNGWVFPIRPSVDAPWMIEVYWEELDLMGTLWPYEVDWYSAQWPADAQPYVRGSSTALGADVLVDMTLSPQLQDAQEPPGHAQLSGNGVFKTTSAGYSLLRFTANDNVWFQTVYSVDHTDQMSGADPLRWPVGTQLQPALNSTNEFAQPASVNGFSADHGYIYDPANRAPYNTAIYQYPTTEEPNAETFIFGVNSGSLEVWWAKKVQQTDMPVPVYFPAWACTYTNVWDTNNAPEIVLASGQGSPAFPSGSTASLYVQNNKDLPGYNPNEEHALMGQDEEGDWVIYALRDDLNVANSSPPFVLANYTDPETDQPLMQVLHVVRTNAAYPTFAYQRVVGDPLSGPRPLDLLPNVAPTTATTPHAWRDRKLTWWAVGAGPGETNTAVVTMINWYPLQQGLGFWFPSAANQPPIGTAVPWLPVNGDPAQPTTGTPLPVSWTLSWPTEVAGMKVGQTLTRATDEGLPEIWNQASVDVAYQQSKADNGDPSAISVRLFDPTVAQAVPFTESLSAYGFEVGPGKNSYTRLGMTYFLGLPPDLSDRFYYDPTRKQLRFIGRLNQSATGPAWLLVNKLSARQRDELKAICSLPAKQAEWNAKIDALATGIVEVAPNARFDHLALAAVGRGAGYVTLAFNNSTDVSEGLPISVQVIKVLPELYAGFLIPLQDPVNLLSEQMNILYSESFAGDADLFDFQWVAVDPPSDGSVPQLPSGEPSSPFAQEDGLTRLRIGGQGATLQDLVNRFFTLRYRAVAGSQAEEVVGSSWSDYADFALAEGWVQRVMFSITPFEQRLRDLYNNPAETRTSMMQQAGKPYVGDVALNMDAINDVGLIELYQTVFNRARRLSLDLGINSPAVNQQLLLAISRLQALYMLLGNEAFADALDPTIGFGSSVVINNAAVLPVDYGAFSSSLFCFANQVPTLLDEELALLRGRGTPGTAPGVNNYPYYNRLLWNFTRGLDAGEVAYAVNYNIHNADDVTISADTAAGFYPQGHGDAYGHYLSALKGYYHLLRNPNFNWGDPSISPLLLGIRTISADYDDETRFAEASAALARTGVEIARRASRKTYTESADSVATTAPDTDSERAWGVTEWVGRTGMGAFYNWAIAQSLLPTQQVDVVIEGELGRIDRTTVKAASEIATHYAALQRELDQIDQSLNPLGLARGAVPFDISPADIDAGKTHFDQVYERAVGALANARTTFDAVQETVRLLRQQSESALQLEESVEDQELDYQNRLIEIFGYPYANDIDPDGTYAQGYDGPDLFHFMYMDLTALGFDKTTDIGTITVTNYTVNTNNLNKHARTDVLLLNGTNVTVHLAANGLQAKPDDWTGERRAEGEIQRAYREFLVAFLELREARMTCENNIARLSASTEWYLQWNKTMDAWARRVGKVRDDCIDYAWHAARAAEAATVGEAVLAWSQIPSQDGPYEQIAGVLAGLGWIAANITEETYEARMRDSDFTLDKEWATKSFNIEDQEMRMAILDLARDQRESASALLVALQKLSDAQAQFMTAVAEGERLLVDRESFRTAAANRIAASRYNDMAFRIFRNDALRRYSDAFELAARYTYLAAKAYDYETGLLPSETAHDPGTQFMDEIIRARTLGRVANGQPVLGVTGIGEPGLADILARMSANWSVLRGRLGFNNPETETGRFSLRTELFRALPGSTGDALWRQKLEQCKVDDLFALPEFRRDCLPFTAQGGLEEREPGLVIPFSSTIDFAKNFFGRDLAGGDNAYDSSHFATKVRSVGVWFTDYDKVTDGSQNVYLANQPRVYLIPVGQDILRSPTGLGDILRTWQVLDQAIPLPFPIGNGDLDQPDWIPMYDTLTSPWAQARRHPSMRAYHDHGFEESEMTYNSRLVGRSVWNTRWLLIIPAGTLHHDRANALDWFIGGATGTNGVSDIKLFFQTYSMSGN